MALKLPKLDRETLLVRRYEYMKQAFELDKGLCQSPFHKAVLKKFSETKQFDLSVLDVHHLNGRTNTGEYDGLEFLITLCRLEHDFCEKGTAKMAGREYAWLILHLLRKSNNDRWSKPRELLEKKISAERLKEIRGIK